MQRIFGEIFCKGKKKFSKRGNNEASWKIEESDKAKMCKKKKGKKLKGYSNIYYIFIYVLLYIKCANKSFPLVFSNSRF